MKLTKTNRIIIAVLGVLFVFFAVLFPPWWKSLGSTETKGWAGHDFVARGIEHHARYALGVVILETAAALALAGLVMFVASGFLKRSKPDEDE